MSPRMLRAVAAACEIVDEANGRDSPLEVGIAFFRQHVLMWPASAMLTGNGVAFVLRVPGTEHGDWWSTNGWWIFAGTAAVSLLSKHLIQFRGGHIFQPANVRLVRCVLLLGPGRARRRPTRGKPISAAGDSTEMATRRRCPAPCRASVAGRRSPVTRAVQNWATAPAPPRE